MEHPDSIIQGCCFGVLSARSLGIRVSKKSREYPNLCKLLIRFGKQAGCAGSQRTGYRVFMSSCCGSIHSVFVCFPSLPEICSYLESSEPRVSL